MSVSVEVQALKLEELIDKAGMKVLPTVAREVGYTHTEVGSLITAKWSFPKVISSIILQHHRDEETRPPMEHAGTLKVLACVDLSNTICKVLGAGYCAPRETLDLVDHPAISFLDIPAGSASELVTELQESFAKEAAYWVH